MSSIRRGLAITTIERQLSLAIQIAVTVVVSRLLTPTEIGVWGIAFAATALLLSVREFGTETFLIQRASLRREEAQAAFSVMLFVGLLIFVLLNLLAPRLAHFYSERGLAPLLHVVALAVLLEVIAAPLVGMMRRNMAFGDVAMVNIVRGATSALVTMGLAVLGFSYMSFAWGWLAAAFLSSALAIYLLPELWVYKARLRGWKEMLTFGGYLGTNFLLYKVYETLPVFLLGRSLSFEAVGIYSRAALVCQLPNNILFGAVSSVLLPALSAEVRAGNNLENSYLRAVSLLTALQWPALVVLAVLAHSLVSILLGGQWLQTVPLIQIMAIAALPSFVTDLAFPALVAVGAMRDLFLRALIVWPMSAALIAGASWFGLTAVALSFLVIYPMQAWVSLHFVRRHLAFGWRELGKACWRSAVITAASAAGPLAIMVWWGIHASVPIPVALAAIALAAAGWFAGVRYTRHELLDEMARAVNFRRWFRTNARRP